MQEQQQDISALIKIMQRLRDPHGGCPWDRAQDFSTIAPYTIEEAYEVADAIARNDMPDLCDELGDLLFQVVFHAQMAEELKAFNFSNVVHAIVDKMIRRHPHVFADAEIADAEQQTLAWEDIKAAERKAAGKQAPLADIPVGLAALQRATKLQKRASRLGFDWQELMPVVDKLKEEIAELDAEIALRAQTDANKKRIAEELGDVLFSVVNLARHLEIDAEGALVNANTRFAQRFSHVCEQAGGAAELNNKSMQQLETYWRQAKQALS